MGVTVRCYVASYHVALRIESIRFGRSRAWDVNGDELPGGQHKAVLLSILAVIEPNDVPLGVYAGDPRKGRVRNVDCAELALTQQKTVERKVTIEIGANNTARVDDHGWKCPQRTRDVDQSEFAVAEQVPVPVEKVRADELHTDDIAGVTDPEASRVYRIGAGEIDCIKCSPGSVRRRDRVHRGHHSFLRCRHGR